VATYDYRDAQGVLRYQVTKHLEPTKTFRQRRPDGQGGWINNIKGVARLPYRLPELLAADSNGIVFVVEGEKDVDNVRKLGLTATCNSMGAGNWPAAISRWLKGRDVVLLPDNDEPGRLHVEDVAEKLAGFAGRIRVLKLPGLPEKGDVSDWIGAGGTADALLQLAEAAPDWEDSDDIRPPDYSDDALALRFTERYEDDLRFVAAWKRWMRWDGQRWRHDNTLRVFDLARAVCREASTEVNKGAKGIASAKTVAAVEYLARTDRHHAAIVDQWDSVPGC
jgi:putative DNA primase/helicase